MRIIHPHTGALVESHDLGRETDINPRTLERRWHAGDRGERLIRPVNPKLSARRRQQNMDREHMARLTAKLEAKRDRQVRQSPEWALLTAPRLADFGRHYQTLQESQHA